MGRDVGLLGREKGGVWRGIEKLSLMGSYEGSGKVKQEGEWERGVINPNPDS